ncbi:MAG: (d)CMP kinase [Balneolaceae bacterium]|nr:(d)CMP kinase [Balneolaceae bacterium]
MIIVIDGPAGSGKSSTAKAVARKMNIEYLDSGALYRAITWLYLEVDQDIDTLFDLLSRVSISFSYTDDVFRVYVNERDVTSKLRTKKVADQVSAIASLPRVRSFVNELMREKVKQGTYIAEGRDLGTAVFTDADLKFFMSANVEERARRRFKELEASGADITFHEVRKNIQDRDRKDTAREADPLKKAPDAIELDTTGMRFDEQVQQICSIIDEQTDLTFK